MSDLTPLAGLSNLWSLRAAKNKVKDLVPLAKLTRLSDIDLKDNQVEDLGPLGNLKDLNILILAGNHVSDLSPLLKSAKADAEGPKRFAPYLRLYLAGNPLSDQAKSEQLAEVKKAGVRVEN